VVSRSELLQGERSSTLTLIGRLVLGVISLDGEVFLISQDRGGDCRWHRRGSRTICGQFLAVNTRHQFITIRLDSIIRKRTQFGGPGKTSADATSESMYVHVPTCGTIADRSPIVTPETRRLIPANVIELVAAHSHSDSGMLRSLLAASCNDPRDGFVQFFFLVRDTSTLLLCWAERLVEYVRSTSFVFISPTGNKKVEEELLPSLAL
jgi:hypothetical protein